MSADNPFVLLPAPEHFSVLNLLVILLLLIHIPYISMMIGGTALSMLFNILGRIDSNRRFTMFSELIRRITMGSPAVILFLGILPLFTLMLLHAQLLYGSDLNIFRFFLAITGLALTGMILLLIHRHVPGDTGASFSIHLAAGSAGLASLLGAYFVLNASLMLFASPESWTLIRTPVPLVFSASAVARFNLFLAGIPAVTGIGLLMGFLRWKQTEDAAIVRLARHWGAGLTLAGMAGIPVSMVWILLTLPVYAMSASLVTVHLLALGTLMICGLAVTGMLQRTDSVLRLTAPVFLLATLFLLFTSDQMARETSQIELRNIMTSKALEIRGRLEEKRGIHGTAAASAAGGIKVFNDRCSMCHAFDRRIVGPPYLDTLPAYIGDLDALESYIKRPVRRNEEYPPMPALGLKDVEVKSVVMYLMDELQKRQ